METNDKNAVKKDKQNHPPVEMSAQVKREEEPAAEIVQKQDKPLKVGEDNNITYETNGDIFDGDDQMSNEDKNKPNMIYSIEKSKLQPSSKFDMKSYQKERTEKA